MAARELLWILPSVAGQVDIWRARALLIPDETIREAALTALANKRFNAEGAALFAVLPPRRDPHLLRLLVSFQILLDFLDNLSEPAVPNPLASALQLHLALREALDPAEPISDYYRHHPRCDDGGYLRALVVTCREACASLPRYGCIRPLAVEGATRCGVQGLNHDPDPVRRDRMLALWAASTFPTKWGMSWWELTAGASSTLGVHALLALAADPACNIHDAADVDAAYMPWICAASTMLDSYVDEVDDAATDGHSYIAHYPSPRVAELRTRELVTRSVWEARRLRRGARHALIAAGMVAMYLSADDARTQAKRASTAGMVYAGGPLTRALVPILRVWRLASARPAA